MADLSETPLSSRLRSDAGCTPTAEPVAKSTTRNLASTAGQGSCICDPRHLEVGAYDAQCPVHDPEAR